jgi:ABC-type dipeptide/oligopeptide/nickel transport system permease subunit
MALGPGLALLSIVIAVNTLGDHLRDALQIKRAAFQN